MLRFFTIGTAIITALVLLLTASLALAGQADTTRALRENDRIDRALTDLTVAYGISLYCPSISARYVRGWGLIRELEHHAVSLGFPRDEVHAYVKDKTERKRVERQARDVLSAKGGRESDPESVCRVGEAEIAAKSQIGLLLRSK
ncbi:DUF5333 domain-containing protein [Tropicimonas isoalkanivorans]|uniref:DUF5333 domain-containing protein n=1 Tax=Tropicimonas isoalkanivorans TaxID=441112 RepID=A0A1I1DT41_9RHOB|nr:DUF5333 domain-containing protein [Tropicimonas isoalkanivorans]SFB75890.1 hypothetical protein SAMN04488094_101332 [Tropicimonas isoalkanivorans]